jgi:hypothetical protein
MALLVWKIKSTLCDLLSNLMQHIKKQDSIPTLRLPQNVLECLKLLQTYRWNFACAFSRKTFEDIGQSSRRVLS